MPGRADTNDTDVTPSPGHANMTETTARGKPIDKEGGGALGIG
jgi:hypothetical protein